MSKSPTFLRCERVAAPPGAGGCRRHGFSRPPVRYPAPRSARAASVLSGAAQALDGGLLVVETNKHNAMGKSATLWQTFPHHLWQAVAAQATTGGPSTSRLRRSRRRVVTLFGDAHGRALPGARQALSALFSPPPKVVDPGPPRSLTIGETRRKDSAFRGDGSGRTDDRTADESSAGVSC